VEPIILRIPWEIRTLGRCPYHRAETFHFEILFEKCLISFVNCWVHLRVIMGSFVDDLGLFLDLCLIVSQVVRCDCVGVTLGSLRARF
jgi:hypothetical protein